eukprot:TRINITY_DN14185_c0_g1_i2.p1 TRINITY_DN14185_c0_g1~~TRINITY_DN14185_c0_g1_i2.p1  ORF type:complete len:500 (-),score=99.43 TRINITY_DN14185_c0_g1_i2:60-1502(-)
MCIRDSYRLADEDDINEDKGIAPDELLLAPKVDSWGSSKVGNVAKENLEHPSTDYFTDHTGNIMNDAKKVITKAKEKSKKFLSGKDAQNSKQVDLNEPQELNPLEEQLRNYKKMQIEAKQSEDESKRVEKMNKDAQAKISRMTQNDKGKKTFTYDFDGNLVPVSQVKLDKLPPSSWAIRYDISEDRAANIMRRTAKSTTSANFKPIPVKVKKNFDSDREIMKNTLPPMQIFEYMNEISPGVTFNEAGKIKRGPRNSTFNNTDIFSETSANMKLTRSEYFQLVRSGEMTRQMPTNPDAIKFDDPGNAHSLTERKGNLSPNLAVGAREQSLESFNRSHPTEPNKRIQAIGSRMIVPDSRKMHDFLLNTEPDRKDHPQNSLMRNLMAQNQRLNTETGPRTINDEYNMELMTARDWGRSTGQPLNVSMRPLPPSSSTGHLPALSYRESLGKMPKYPRERMKKMNERHKTEHLPPPPLGLSLIHI